MGIRVTGDPNTGSVKFTGAGGSMKVTTATAAVQPNPSATITVPGFGDVTLSIQNFNGTADEGWVTQTTYLMDKWSGWIPLLKVSTSPTNMPGPPGAYYTIETAQQAPINQAGTSAGDLFGLTTLAGDFVPLAVVSEVRNSDGVGYSNGDPSLGGASKITEVIAPDGETYVLTTVTGGRASPDTGIAEPGAILPGQAYALKVRITAYSGAYASATLLGSAEVTLNYGVAPAAPVLSES